MRKQKKPKSKAVRAWGLKTPHDGFLSLEFYRTKQDAIADYEQCYMQSWSEAWKLSWRIVRVEIKEV